MRIMLAKCFIALVVFAATPTFSFANATSTVALTTSCEPCGRHVVAAFDYNDHVMFLYAGQHVHINLSGDGDTDVDLLVYDYRGNLVARSEGRTDDEMIGLNVYRSGYFTIRVKNLGRVYNSYQLWVN